MPLVPWKTNPEPQSQSQAVSSPLQKNQDARGHGCEPTEQLVHRVGDLELAVLPLELVAGGCGLVATQGGTVDAVGVGLVGGTIPDECGDLQCITAESELAGHDKISRDVSSLAL